jgi:plasmid replication initiation protein
MEEFRYCGEEINRAIDCLNKFNIMDDNKSFVKIDDEGNFKYIWCVNCKRYNKELEELLEKNEKKIIEYKDDELEKEIYKKDIQRILNDA